MQTHAWMQARVGALSRSLGLRCFAVRSGGGFAALAPLFELGGWLREPPALYEPSDLIWSEPAALAELASMLASQPAPVYLERMPADSPTLPALRRAYAGRGRILIRPAMATPFVELDGPSRLDADSLFSPARHSDFRRAERRAREFGAVAYELHSPSSSAELNALMDEIYAVEARSWKESAHSSLTADRWQGDFFRGFAEEAMRMGMLRIAVLRIAGEAAATQIAAEWRQRFWLFKISYDSAYSRCSPGQLLMRHTLVHAARAGLLSYEFMGVMDDWTARWTRRTRSYVQVRAMPFNISTARLLFRSGARTLARGLKRMIR